jgi:hypothetical protein
MGEALTVQFTKHLDDGIMRMNDNAKPYSQFVKTVRSLYAQHF